MKSEEITRYCPLFERYPGFAGKIPWIALGRFPVPLQRLERLGKTLGASDLWILREDQSGELYGGNKVRKLEFSLADARMRRKSVILTFGGIGSNHVLATTIYAKSLGMETIGVLAPQPITDHVVKNLRAYAYFGTNVQLLGKTSDIAKIVATYPKRLIPKTYMLTFGGSNAMGTLGFINCAFEIKDQIDSGKLPNIKEIWVAAGSGGTVAGLLIGKKLCGLDAEIKGVRVAMPQFVNDFAVARLANRTSRLLHSVDDSIPEMHFQASDVNMVKGFIGPGYGFPTDEAQAAVEMMEDIEDIHCEITYTGKTIAAMMRNIPYNADAPIMYIHTLNSVNIYDAIPDDLDLSVLPESLQKIAEGKETNGG